MRSTFLPLAGSRVDRQLAIIARVEHVFRVLKCQFGYRRVRYRGIEENGAHVFSLLALANLFLARKKLAAVAKCPQCRKSELPWEHQKQKATDFRGNQATPVDKNSRP